MAKDNLIPPFPADIDRDAFGHWLCGFADGEACFWLGFNSRKRGRRTPCCRFLIGLRHDDVAILRLVRSYFGVGRLHFSSRAGKTGRTGAQPTFHYTVTTCADHLHVIVPFFERFPLRSKKARDFPIWRTAVRFACERQRRGKGMLHWTDAELGQFAGMVTLLRDQRRPDCLAC